MSHIRNNSILSVSETESIVNELDTDTQQSTENIIKSHIVHCIDTGWSFVHMQAHAEDVFRKAKDVLEVSPSIADPVGRVETLKVALANIVEAGWPHINILGASNNVKNTFKSAKIFLAEEKPKNHNRPQMTR